MTFEKVTNKDVEALGNLQPEGWDDIKTQFKFYIDKEFCYPIKISSGNEIQGLGALLVFEKTAWLAHIIVHQKYRRQGLGAKIVEELLKKAKELPIKTILLIATDMGQPVYEKIGFQVTGTYLFLKRENKNQPTISFSPTSPPKSIVPYHSSFKKQLLDLDQQICGENRSRLIEGFLENAWIYLGQNKKVEGYYLPQLDEGPIYAIHSKAGLALMDWKHQKIDKAVLPKENKAGVEFLKKEGFEIFKEASRMTLGPEINWQASNIYSRIAGNFG